MIGTARSKGVSRTAKTYREKQSTVVGCTVRWVIAPTLANPVNYVLFEQANTLWQIGR